MKRKDINVVSEEIKLINPNIIITDDNYKDVHSKTRFRCNKHNYDFEATPATFIYKKSLGCYYCKSEAHISGGNHIPIQEVKQVTQDHGLIFKDVVYKKQKCYVKFICPIHEDRGEQEVTLGNLRRNKRSCCYCSGINRSTEDFIQIINDKYDNLEILGDYNGAKERVTCKCIKHDYIWKPYAYNLLSGCGCPLCGREQIGLKKRLSDEEKLDRIQKIHPDIQVLELGNTSKDYSKFLCKKCNHIWYATFTNVTNPRLTTGCPVCNESKGEKRVRQCLEQLQVDFIPQYIFNDCRDIKPLPFDFFLPNYRVAIEYDGEFHYIARYDTDRFTAEENLEYTQRHDQIKTLYCINNSIKLIRIPYWDFDRIDKYITIEKLNA